MFLFVEILAKGDRGSCIKELWGREPSRSKSICALLIPLSAPPLFLNDDEPKSS